MANNSPPTIDPQAALRWLNEAPAQSPWLHEEVARRMAERLQWIKLTPSAWAHWEAVRGGLAGHGLVAAQYPQARSHVVESAPARAQLARTHFGKPWWNPLGWGASPVQFGEPGSGAVQMLWSNMLLHLHPDPRALIRQWHNALATDGFLMFSCLGPDTLRELRQIYADMGWGESAHALTDMHDWGDMLVEAGFADPVMDMERITLSYTSPARILDELRDIGKNLHAKRLGGLRTPRWRAQLEAALLKLDRGNGMTLSFEVIYGHAIKPAPRVRLEAQSTVSLGDMRDMLKGGRPRG